MVQLTIELPEDLAGWLAGDAARRRCSRQDLVIEMLQDKQERDARFNAILTDSIEKNQELLRRLAE